MGKNKIVGYTTGVYDLFHIGHLNILRLAKEHCDHLVVGVSTDELVITYKHRRPIIPFEERIQIVEAIQYVDEVVPQTTMDKYQAWEKIHYDRIFHGDDWKGNPLYNEMECRLKKVGVEVIYFPYTQGTSSTILSDALYMMINR